MTEILLIRHPETDLAGTFCGHTDPPINAAGRTQMNALLKTLQDEEMHAVYTSDLQRARVLAEAIAEARQISCVIRPALRELHFGDWEACTWAEIERRSPEQAAAWLAEYPHRPAPNGESHSAFQARVLGELDGILAEKATRIAVVSHAGVLRTILTLRAKRDEAAAWALTKPYCALVRYTAKPAAVAQ